MEFESIQGLEIPKLGLGTWNLRGRECYRAVLSALELGYRHIDTAEMYANEDQIGRAIADSGVNRSEIFLVSKVWDTHLRHDRVLSACEASLRNLGVEALDLYLIHWPSNDVPIEETMRAMNELAQSRKARSIGVSNFSVREFEAAQAASEVRLLTNQIPFHPYRPQERFLAYCQANDLLLTAYSPLAKGRVANDRTLAAIGDRHGVTSSQVALRWLVQQPKVAAIPKSSHPGRQQENFEIFDFELSAEDMAEISALSG